MTTQLCNSDFARKLATVFSATLAVAFSLGLSSCGGGNETPRSKIGPSEEPKNSEDEGAGEGEESGPNLSGELPVYVKNISLNNDTRFSSLVGQGIDIKVQGGFIKEEDLEGHLEKLSKVLPLFESRVQHIDELILGFSPKFSPLKGKSQLTVPPNMLGDVSLVEFLELHDKRFALEEKIAPMQIVFDNQSVKQVEFGLKLIEAELSAVLPLKDKLNFLEASLWNKYDHQSSTYEFVVNRETDMSATLFRTHMFHIGEELELRERFSEFEFIDSTNEDDPLFVTESEFLKGLKELAQSEAQVKILSANFESIEISSIRVHSTNNNRVDFENKSLSFAVRRSQMTYDSVNYNFFDLSVKLVNLSKQWNNAVIDTSSLRIDMQLIFVVNLLEELVPKVSDAHHSVKRISIENKASEAAYDSASQTLRCSAYDSAEEVLNTLLK